MWRRRRVVAGLAAIGVAGGLAWWWLRDGSPGGDDGGPGARTGAHGAARLERHTTPGMPRWLGQPGVQPRRVAGRVTYHGAPVAGATVRLELAGLVQRVVPARTVTSGADGRFDLGPQVALEVIVIASAPARSSGGVSIDLRDPTLAPAPDRLELVLGDCTHSVFGKVHDHGGSIAGATLRASTWRESYAASVTDDDGNYNLCLSPGGAWMSVEADGYARAQLEVGGGKRERRDVELSPEAILAGVVLGPGDAPVAGALVTCGSSEMERFMVRDAVANTDDQGRFTIGGIPPGRYALRARDVGLATGEEVEAVAQVGEPGEDAVLRLEAAAVVHGHVLEGDRPVAGARISYRSRREQQFVPTFSPNAEAVSQADGSFVIDGVLPGPFKIEVDDYELIEPTAPVAALPDTELTVKVAGMARVSGRVTREGKPVAGARVNVRGGRNLPGGSELSRAHGTYEIGGLAAGTYQIGAQSDNAFARNTPLTVAKGQRLEGVDIELDLAGEVSGVVVDQRGDPVGGVAVSFEMGPAVDWGFATTESDGTFVAGAMSGGGEYAITVRPSGSSPLQFSPAGGGEFPKVALTDGRSRATVRIAIQVDRKQIKGVVVRGDGKPAADVVVSAFPPMEERFMMRYSLPAAEATTGTDGRFVLRDLLAGDYTVRASTGVGLEAIEDKVPAGRDNLRLALPATGSIEGELVGFSEKARVTAFAAGAADQFRGRVTGNRFTIQGLAPGQYYVSANEGGRSDHAVADVAGGKSVSIKLTSEGTATVSGRAIDVVTGAPLPGFECTSGMGGGKAEAISDRDGRFEVEVPARREAHVGCRSHEMGRFSVGAVEVKLEPGARAEVVVDVVVQRRAELGFGDIGIDLARDKPPRVDAVTPGGPGERAGVAVGDAILKVDGVAVATRDPRTAYLLMLDHEVGEKVELVLGRDGREVAASVEVAARKR